MERSHPARERPMEQQEQGGQGGLQGRAYFWTPSDFFWQMATSQDGHNLFTFPVYRSLPGFISLFFQKSEREKNYRICKTQLKNLGVAWFLSISIYKIWQKCENSEQNSRTFLQNSLKFSQNSVFWQLILRMSPETRPKIKPDIRSSWNSGRKPTRTKWLPSRRPKPKRLPLWRPPSHPSRPRSRRQRLLPKSLPKWRPRAKHKHWPQDKRLHFLHVENASRGRQFWFVMKMSLELAAFSRNAVL